jgi:hypothetical protein
MTTNGVVRSLTGIGWFNFIGPWLTNPMKKDFFFSFVCVFFGFVVCLLRVV